MAYDSKSKVIAIDQPVSVPDVQQALGTNANDLATLCALNNINKWSRFKPIRDPRAAIKLTEKASNTSPFYNYQLSQLEMNYGSAGDVPNPQGGCGLNIRAHSYLSDLLDEALVALDWEYLRPTGKRTLSGASTTNSAYWTAQRLGDFRGYKHNAQSPFYDLALGNVLPLGGEIPMRSISALSTAGSTTTEYAGVAGSGVSLTPGALTLSELMFPTSSNTPFTQAKLGLVLFAKNAQGEVDPGTHIECTARAFRSGDGPHRYFPFPNNHFSGAGWKHGAVAIPFYCLKEITAGSAWSIQPVVIHPDRLRFDVTFGSTTGSQIITVQVTIARREQFGSMAPDGTISSVRPISWALKITVEDNGGGGNYHEFHDGNVFELLSSNDDILWQSSSIIDQSLNVTGSFTKAGQITRFTAGVTSDSQLTDAVKVRVRLGTNYSAVRYIANDSSSGQISAILP